jgi:hypothetical protein
MTETPSPMRRMDPSEAAEVARYERMMGEIEKQYDGAPPPVGSFDRVKWQKLRTRVERIRAGE